MVTKQFLEDILKIYETGTPEEIRRAKRDFEKACRSDFQLCVRNKALIFRLLAHWETISDPARQAAVISGLGLAFSSLADENLPVLRDFILKAIQHPNGHVRDAAVKAAEWLRMSLDIRARPMRYGAMTRGRLQDSHANHEARSTSERAREEYKDYVRAVELMLDYYDNGDEEDALYIDQMKPSPRKSLEMLWDRLTHGGYELLAAAHVPPPEIVAKREELETRIAELLDRAGSDFCFHDVIERIYYEESIDELGDIVAMFDGGEKTNDAVVATVNDAWNYFPHQALGGLCPAEKLNG